MLNKKWLILIEKYSFIEKVTQKGITVSIHYYKDGKLKCKKLPLRATANQLNRTITNIRKETDVSVYGKGQNSNYYIA